MTALLDLMYSPVEHAGQRLDCHQAVVRVEHAVPLLGQGVARNSCSPRRALADAAPCGGAWTNMIFIRGSEGSNEMCTEETCTEEMCTDETMGTLPRDTPIPPPPPSPPRHGAQVDESNSLGREDDPEWPWGRGGGINAAWFWGDAQ